METVTAPRAMGVRTECQAANDIPIAMESLLRKKEILKAAADEFCYEVWKIEKELKNKKEDMMQEEEKLKWTKAQEKSSVDSAVKLERIQRKEVHLENLEKKLNNEKEMLFVGREMHIESVKRHQMIMGSTIAELKQAMKKERADFVDSVVQEIEAFKLPSANAMFGTQNETVIKEIKELCEDCLGLKI